jgi:ribose transport system ATP-binding protein
MDIAAKQDVVRIIRGLREKGIAIIVTSTEPETILALADRVVVMKKGTVARICGRAIGERRPASCSIS